MELYQVEQLYHIKRHYRMSLKREQIMQIWCMESIAESDIHQITHTYIYIYIYVHDINGVIYSEM